MEKWIQVLQIPYVSNIRFLYNFQVELTKYEYNAVKLFYTDDKRPIPQASGKFIKENDVDFRAFKLNQRTTKDTDVLNRTTWEESFEAIVDAGIPGRVPKYPPSSFYQLFHRV